MIAVAELRAASAWAAASKVPSLANAAACWRMSSEIEEVLDEIGIDVAAGGAELARADDHDQALVLSEQSIAIGQRASDGFGLSMNLELQLQIFGAIERRDVALAVAVILTPLLRATQQHAKAEQLEWQLEPILSSLGDENRDALSQEAAGLDPLELPPQAEPDPP